MGRKRMAAGLAVFITSLGAAPAQAEIRAAEQSDPRGDSSTTLSGSRLIDVTKVGVRYDTDTGTLTVRFDADMPVADYASLNFTTTISQGLKADGSCAVQAGDADYTIYGSTYYGRGYSGTSASLSNKFGYVGSGSATFDGGGATFSFTGGALIRRDYVCIGATTVSRSTTGSGSSSDEVASFCLVPNCGKREPVVPTAVATLDVSVPTLNATTFMRGQTIFAKATYANTSRGPIGFEQALITARPLGSTRPTGPIRYFFLGDLRSPIPAGKTELLEQQLTIPADAPLGRYNVYATYRDADGIWHDSPDVTFDVVPTPSGQPPISTNIPNPPTPVNQPGGGITPGGSNNPGGSGGSTGGSNTNSNTGSAGTTPSTVRVPGGLEAELGSLGTRLRNLQRSSGLRVSYECSKACELDARLTLRGRLVARGTVARVRAGSGTLRLRATSAGKRRLRNLRRATFVLTLKVTDADGDVRTVRRTVRMR